MSTPPQDFKTCLEITPDTKEAIGCCMSQCNDFECQEHCIESYNSLIDISENFILGYDINRSLVFLILIIAFQASTIYGYIQLPAGRFKSLQYITAIYCVLYYTIMHVL